MVAMAGNRQTQAVILAILLLASVIYMVDGQFFTKSLSKSIPRMGRRSEQVQVPRQQYRNFLINNLIDAYGPNLMENLLVDQTKPAAGPSADISYGSDDTKLAAAASDESFQQAREADRPAAPRASHKTEPILVWTPSGLQTLYRNLGHATLGQPAETRLRGAANYGNMLEESGAEINGD